MKKLLILLLCMAAWNSTVSAEGKEFIELQISIIDEKPSRPTMGKVPLRVPTIYHDDHLFYLSASHPEYIINIVQDDEMVFTSVIPAGITEFELPAYIEGECQIQFVCGRFSFIGFINLK